MSCTWCFSYQLSRSCIISSLFAGITPKQDCQSSSYFNTRIKNRHQLPNQPEGPLFLKNMRSSIKKSKFFSEIKTRGSSPGRMLKCFNSSDLNRSFLEKPTGKTRGGGVTWMGSILLPSGTETQNTHISFSISMNLEQQNPDKSFIQDFRCFFCNYCVLPWNQCVPFIAPKKKCSDNSWSFAACRISVSKATEMESTAKSTADWLLWVNS